MLATRLLVPALLAASLAVGCNQSSTHERSATDQIPAPTTQSTNTATAGGAAPTGATPASSTPQAGVVNVVASEYALQLPSSLPEGPTTFSVVNSGRVVHSFRITGNGISAQLAKDLGPGESGTLKVDLKAGTYQVECPIDGHAGKGMTAQITVGKSMAF